MSAKVERKLFIVANSVRPYGFEAAKVLSLPEGAEFRARFPSKWIAQNVRDDPDSVVGSKAFYIFRNFETGELVPTRELIINSLRIHGDIFLFRYAVSSYIDYDADTGRRNSQIKSFNKKFLDDHGGIIENSDGGCHLSPLVLFSSMPFEFTRHSSGPTKYFDEQTASWMATVDHIGSNFVFEDFPFYRLAAISDLSNDRIINLDSGSLRLTCGKTYQIEILSYIPYTSKGFHGTREDEAPRGSTYLSKGPVKFILELDEKSLQGEKIQSLSAGQYDISTLRFRTLDSPMSSVSVLGISIDAPSQNDFSDPFAIELPVLLHPKTAKIFALMFLFAAFFAIYTVPSLIPPILSDAHKEIARDVSVIGFSLVIWELISELRNYFRKR